MTVFPAMLLDAYRELNSRRLFWVTLGLSMVVVLTYLSIGFDETGMSMFFGLSHTENPLLVKGSPAASILYRSVFSTFIVSIWLAWIAVILAIISTTTIFPDFIAGGAIDLVLSKPIGRIRLFFYKYLVSLLFVTLQVTVFCVGIFFCLGLRIGEWEWKILLTIPIIVLFYSYLFSVNVLVGVWTRSALAALLLTMLFWVSLWSINQAEIVTNMFQTQFAVQAEQAEADIARLEENLKGLDAIDRDRAAPGRIRIQAALDQAKDEAEQARDIQERIKFWHGPTHTVQMVMPKTSETVALVDRWLRKATDINLMDIFQGNVAQDEGGNLTLSSMSRDREVAQRLEDEYDGRSAFYLIASSLLFEAVVLSLACWIFVRRDY